MANTPRPSEQQKPADEQKPEEQTSSADPAVEDEAPAEPKTKYLQFDPTVKSTLSGTEHQISKTQLVEAGVKKPFAKDDLTLVCWNAANNFRVEASLFTSEAIDRLVQEPDIKIVEV